MPKTISIYVTEAIEKEVSLRGDNRSQIINRDLERLYGMYKRALKEVGLTIDEARLIVDALNGAIFDANSARLLYANIEDAINLDKLDVKWGVDGPKLLEKLKPLTILHCFAIIDAAERYWYGEESIEAIFGFEKVERD